MAGTLSLIPESAPSTWVWGGGRGEEGKEAQGMPSKSSPDGSMTRLGGGTKSEVDHKKAQWLHACIFCFQ